MTKHSIYYPQLDAIRAFAVLFVFMCHSELGRIFLLKKSMFQFTGGEYGVEIFFVLSGYLITSILVKEVIQTGTISRLNFYYKRVLRLYPAIWVAVIVFVIPIFILIGKHEAISNGFFLVTYTGDVVPVFTYLFKSLQFPLFFGHTWTLAIEEQFYLIYPVILILIFKYYNKYKGKKNLINTFPIFNILFIIILIACSVILKEKYYKFFLWRLFEIFFGSYLALIYNGSYNNNYPEQPRTVRIKAFTHKVNDNKYVAIASLLIFIYFLFFNKPLPFNLNYYIITVISSVFIINALSAKFKLVNNILTNKILIYIGKISYGIYLFHYPILISIEYNYVRIPIDMPDMFSKAIVDDIICFIITLALSILSYELIEKRFLKLKRNIGNKPVMTAAV